MIPFLLDVLVIALGTALAVVVVGGLALWLILRWIDGDGWAERSCDNVDGPS